MKEFVVYTVLRLLLLAATFGIVVGGWVLVGGSPNLVVAIVVAFVVSGAGSWFVLQRPRAAFARRVETRAERMTSSIEALRAKEDDEVDAIAADRSDGTEVSERTGSTTGDTSSNPGRNS